MNISFIILYELVVLEVDTKDCVKKNMNIRDFNVVENFKYRRVYKFDFLGTTTKYA